MKIVKSKMATGTDGRTRYRAPAQYHFDRYYTQDPNWTLFRAVRRAIRHTCNYTIGSLGDGKIGLWEVGNEFVFITNKEYARRAQNILIRAQNLYKPGAYTTCKDLSG